MKFNLLHIRRSFMLLEYVEKIKYLLFLAIQCTLGILDLFGLAIIGLLSFTSIYGLAGSPTTGINSTILTLFGLAEMSFVTRIIVLSLIAILVLLSRTLITIYLTRRGLRFLARASSRIASQTFSRFLNSPFAEIQKVPSQEVIYLFTKGVDRLILGVLGSSITMVSDAILIGLVILSLVLIDFQLAILTLFLFLLTAYILKKFSGTRASDLSKSISDTEIQMNSIIQSAIESYREILVRNIRHEYVLKLEKNTKHAWLQGAEIALLPFMSKYIIEICILVFAFVMGGFQLLISDAKNGVATLALFAAAGGRILPAVLRIQQGNLSIQTSVGTSNRTWNMIENLTKYKDMVTPPIPDKNDHSEFDARIKIRNLTYRPSNNRNFELFIERLDIEAGQMVAIVGPSGSGKSTLADLILGVHKPDSGKIEISNLTPREAISRFSGSISYIPQNIFIENTSIKENITMGIENSIYDDKLIHHVLKAVRLDSWIESLPEGINTVVGESGKFISGGQKQRLGIARALFTQPQLIVMDEATRALDAKVEVEIAESIEAMKGKVTLLIIAHSLATVKRSDFLILLNSGKIQAEGTFQEIRDRVPDFAQQAKLLGI